MRFIAASMRPRAYSAAAGALRPGALATITPFSVAASTLTFTGPPRVTITSFRSSRALRTFRVMGASWVTITSAPSPASMTSSSLPAASLTSATSTCGSIGQSKSRVAMSRSSPSSSSSASTIRRLSMWRSPATSIFSTLIECALLSRRRTCSDVPHSALVRPPPVPLPLYSPEPSRVVEGVQRGPVLAEAHLADGPVHHTRHETPVLAQLDTEHPAQREPDQGVVGHDEHRPARVRAGEVREDFQHPVGPFLQRLATGEPVLRRLLEAPHGPRVLLPDLDQSLPLPPAEVQLPQPSVGLRLQAASRRRWLRRQERPPQRGGEHEVHALLLRAAGEGTGLLVACLGQADVCPAHVAVVAVPLGLPVAGEE